MTAVICCQIVTNNTFKYGNIMNKFDKWLTIVELANYIKMSLTKLYGMAQRGEVPASRIRPESVYDEKVSVRVA